MRVSINIVPVAADTTTYQNTDFDPNQPQGGICVSCHNTERTKFLQTPNDATKTPPVPFEMGGDITKAVTVFKRSTHSYSATSAPYKGPDGTGTSTFEAVCLKCHNDTIGGNTGPKSAVSAQDSDGTQPAFGRHISSNDSSMAVLGVTFEQGTAENGGTQLTLFDSTNSGWSSNQWIGYDVIITGGKGEHQRAIIVSNTPDTLTVQDPGFTSDPANHPDSTSAYDLVRSPLPAQEVCFSCHSKAADGRKDIDDLDWYEEEPMKELLQRMEGIFVGDKGVNRTTNSNKDTIIEICTQKTDTQLAAGDFENYVYKTGTFKTIILTNTQPAGPPGDTTCSGPYPNYPNHVTLSINQLDNSFYPIQAGASYDIFKPAFHPLDNYGRHRPYERVAAPGTGGVLGTAITKFWNIGDEGAASEGSTASTIVDIEKAWGTNMWTAGGDAGQGMYVSMQSGLNTGLREMISSNDATSLTLASAFPNTVAAGDAYFIGSATESRHTSCVDCHNPHASSPNPEDEITLTDENDTNAECGTADDCLVVASGQNDFWAVDEWKGHLLKLRKPDDHPTPSLQGHEQIRFITAFDPQFAGGTKGKYTIAIKWRYPPEADDFYEVIMSDKWDATTGQDGNRAGAGSTGTWGVTVSGWTSGTGFVRADGNLVDTSLLTYTKVENVFDKTGSYGGSADTGQRDLCLRCHSYYAFRLARPTVPDGEPDLDDIADYSRPARESDIAGDYNPENVAHHAVFERGNNQPVQKGTNTYGTGAFNPNWPVWNNSNGTISSVNVSTCEVDFGANMPETVLPGWFLHVGTNNWTNLNSSGGSIKFYEVWTIIDQNRVTVDPCPDGSEAGQNFFLTSGLGNTFVPPYGPWSILRCTDCHGSTKTDPVGPHASANKWLMRDGDYKLKLEWYDGSTVQDIDYETEWANGVNEKRYLCYNCHRVDAYGSKTDASGGVTPSNGNMTRLDHGGMYAVEGRVWQECNVYAQDNCSLGVGWSQFCRHCHGGDKLGAIHGSNMAQVKGDAVPQSIRFLNGASWSNGLKRPTPADSDLICYTQSNPTNLSGCAGHDGGKPAATDSTEK
jgi:hypothetical protein